MSTSGTTISSRAPEPVGPYPHARRVGDLLFLSGIGPRERGTTRIPGVEFDTGGNIVSYDIEAQCHSVFRNVRYILEDAGENRGCHRVSDEHEEGLPSVQQDLRRVFQEQSTDSHDG